MGKFTASIAIILSVLVGNAAAQETIIVYGNSSKPPKNYNDTAQQPQGILVDMMKVIGKDIGVNFDVQLYTWQQAYAYATQGKGIIIGLSMNDERLKIFDYSNVMYYDDIMIAVLAGNEFPFEKIDDLDKKIIAMIRGATFGNEYEDALRRGVFTVIPISTSTQRFWALLYGQVDAVFIGPGVAGYKAVINSDPELAKIKHRFNLLPKPFKSDPNYIGIPRIMKRQDLLPKINASLANRWQDGTFEKIVEKHTT